MSLLVTLGLAVGACGGAIEELVEVPDVMGMTAAAAAAEVEAEGELTVAFDPEPDDPSLCTVEDQDVVGEAESGTEVTLTLDCLVEVPDVTGVAAAEAQAEIESTGELTATFDPEPADPSLCTVEDQDPTDEAEPGGEVILTLDCGVEVPDVTGLSADQAQAEIESTGNLTATFDPDPADLSLCTVDDQDPTAEADLGSEVVLYLSCEDRPPPEGQPSACHPSYPSHCLDPDAVDYDCASGTGDGPEYVDGPVEVRDPDPFDLDRDTNGVGCE